jgi:hypothetical protein
MPDFAGLFYPGIPDGVSQVVHDIDIFHPNKPQRIHSNNSYATPSAVVEKDRVYVHYVNLMTGPNDNPPG